MEGIFYEIFVEFIGIFYNWNISGLNKSRKVNPFPLEYKKWIIKKNLHIDSQILLKFFH